MKRVLYRYELSYWKGSPALELVEYEILKDTPKGYWIRQGGKYGVKRWISKNARNKYAHKSVIYALKGYIRRKTYRNVCIESELIRNEETIKEAKYLIKQHDKQGKK